MTINYPEIFNGKRVLITGASGFIGGALADVLVMAGAEVYVIGRGVDYGKLLYGSVDKMNVPLAHMVERIIFCDITDFFQVGHAIKVADPDYIFHLAAVTQVTEAKDWAVHCFNVNTMGTLNLLEAARLTKPDAKIIITTTDKVYGHPHKSEMPCTENTHFFVTHPYDASKASADLIARAYAVQYGMKISVTRNANVYGPGDTNWKRIIPGLIRWTFNRERPVIRSDGLQVRQYVYISDVVDGLLRVANWMNRQDASYDVWNMGPMNDGYSVIDIIFETAMAIGKEWGVWMVEPDIRGEAHDESDRLVIDSSFANAMLGWTPTTDLSHGIRLTAEWFARMTNKEYLLK